MSNYGKVGYDFEDAIKRLSKELQKKYKADFYRYPDFKSTGLKGYAKKAPADFYVLIEGVFSKIECKASNKYKSLRECLKSMLEPHQAAELRKAKMAGGKGFVFFYSKVAGVVEVWDISTISEVYYKERGRLTKEHEPVLITTLKDMVEDIIPILIN